MRLASPKPTALAKCHPGRHACWLEIGQELAIDILATA
jgi:hypothetical protein